MPGSVITGNKPQAAHGCAKRYAPQERLPSRHRPVRSVALWLRGLAAAAGPLPWFFPERRRYEQPAALQCLTGKTPKRTYRAPTQRLRAFARGPSFARRLGVHRGCNSRGSNSVVECNLAKVDVESSNLFSRSKYNKQSQRVLRFSSGPFFFSLTTTRLRSDHFSDHLVLMVQQQLRLG